VPRRYWLYVIYTPGMAVDYVGIIRLYRTYRHFEIQGADISGKGQPQIGAVQAVQTVQTAQRQGRKTELRHNFMAVTASY
jgi:hypothetical protein